LGYLWKHFRNPAVKMLVQCNIGRLVFKVFCQVL